MGKGSRLKRIKRKIKRRQEKKALDIIEEAVHLVRTSPLETLAFYYIGSLPFILALLYFWTDMARSAFAYKHSAESALGLTLLFIWMKSWHTAFTHQLLISLRGERKTRWGIRRIMRLVVVQTIIQSWGIVVLPLSLLVTLPFPWLYAFYQNVTVFGDGANSRVGTVVKRAWKQAKLWPKQNTFIIWLLSPWLLSAGAVIVLVLIPFVAAVSDETSPIVFLYVFFAILLLLNPLGIIIAVNIAIAIVWIPQLMKIFFGIETIFTLSGLRILNTTFFAVVCSMTYLCLDPLIKAGYTLRCFYGESVRSGEDLKTELQHVSTPARKLFAGIVLGVCLLASFDFQAEASNNPLASAAARQSTVSAQELDESIGRVMNDAEYAWRMPRGKSVRKASEEDRYPKFLTAIFDTLKSWGKTIDRWLSNIGRWFRKITPARSPRIPGSQRRPGLNWLSIQGLIYLLLSVVACMLAILLWRAWQRRIQEYREEIVVEEISPLPDVADENVDPRELPEDSWLALAEKLIKEGQLRLALRAFYLAILAYLAQHELITIAKFKSNRDYHRELKRRAYTMPDVHKAFTENMLLFERVWYGTYEVTQSVMEHFTTNQKKIKRLLASERDNVSNA